MYARRRRNPGSGRENPERQFWEKVFLLRVESYRDAGWDGSSAECAAQDADSSLKAWKLRFPDRLRDAAPKLLDACKEGFRLLEEGIDNEKELRAAREDMREAIEAAEGPKPESIQ